MDPVWLKSYEPGVPFTIDPDAFSSLNAIFARAFERFSHLNAFTNLGQYLTYTELEQQSRYFASFIRHKLGMQKGERFAIMLPNVLQYPVALIGVLRAGCIVVNVNPLYTPDEFSHQMRDAGATGLIVLENFAHIASAAISTTPIKHVIVAKISDVFTQPKATIADIVVHYIKRIVPKWQFNSYYKYKDVLQKGAKLPFTEASVTGKDVAFLQYTGGTTGVPKGAMITHRNLVANIMQTTAWVQHLFEPGKEIVITALPMYHIFSLTANCLTFINQGALNVLITDPRDVKTFINTLKKYKFTAMTGVNTLFNLLLNSPGFDKLDFSYLKITLGGGMAVQQAVANRWKEVTKKPITEAYGLTETSPAACINPFNLTEYNGTVGLPIPSTEISVRDDDGKELGLDQPGELWIRGPQVTPGYWKQEQETKLAITSDGWFKTGDIVIVNDKGFVRVVDRKKDMILVSGFNVYPNEVEAVIAMMPEVKEVAVVSAPDAVSGEMVKAFIVPRNPTLTVEKVRQYCHQHLTGYKIPKVVEFRNELPKTNVGKILRRALR